MSITCAVIGNPIAHSKSPEIHHGFAARYAIDLDYQRILVPEGKLAGIVSRFFADGGRGLNVTVPCKEDAFALCDRLTPYAERAGAVNTLWQENGKLYGDNTDGRGLVRALTHDLQQTLAGKRILLLGAGGAARGVLLPLLEEQPGQLTIANRTLAKAQALATSTDSAVVDVLAFDDAPQAAYDVIINATSTGLSDQPFIFSPQALQAHTVCYEMMYGKQTPFMHWAETHSTQSVHDGYSMLVNQAWLSFQRWFGREIEQNTGEKNDA